MKRVALLLVFVLLLCGCNREVTDYTLNVSEITTASDATEPTQPASQNCKVYATYPVEHPAENISGNIFYYANVPFVSYYDFEIERRVVPCSQPNCTHSDESCFAYLGKGDEVVYQVVEDIAYAIVNNNSNGGKTQFIALNLVSGQRETLWDLTPEKGTVRMNVDLSIDGKTAFIQFEQYDLDVTAAIPQSNIINYAYAYDLATNETELLLEAHIPSCENIPFPGDHLVLSATTEEYLFLADVEDAETPLTEAEFLKENPDGDYMQYMMDLMPETKHYSIDRTTGQRTQIYGSDSDARIIDSTALRDRKVSFMDGTAFCIYDGRTGQVTRFFEKDNVGCQSYMDGRLIYNVRTEESDEIKWYWYDLTTGETQQFQVGTNNMVFSVYAETADYFIGLYAGKNCYISKQDFYNENWEAAKSM